MSAYKGTHFDKNGVATLGRQRSYRRYLGNNINPTYNNPLWTIYEQKATTVVNRFNANSNLNINPISWLQLDFRGGLILILIKEYTSLQSVRQVFNNGRLDNENFINSEINLDAIARADFPNLVPDKIGLNATLGYNINDRNRNSLYAATQTSW